MRLRHNKIDGLTLLKNLEQCVKECVFDENFFEEITSLMIRLWEAFSNLPEEKRLWSDQLRSDFSTKLYEFVLEPQNVPLALATHSFYSLSTRANVDNLLRNLAEKQGLSFNVVNDKMFAYMNTYLLNFQFFQTLSDQPSENILAFAKTHAKMNPNIRFEHDFGFSCYSLFTLDTLDNEKLESLKKTWKAITNPKFTPFVKAMYIQKCLMEIYTPVLNQLDEMQTTARDNLLNDIFKNEYTFNLDTLKKLTIQMEGSNFAEALEKKQQLMMVLFETKDNARFFKDFILKLKNFVDWAILFWAPWQEAIVCSTLSQCLSAKEKFDFHNLSTLLLKLDKFCVSRCRNKPQREALLLDLTCWLDFVKFWFVFCQLLKASETPSLSDCALLNFFKTHKSSFARFVKNEMEYGFPDEHCDWESQAKRLYDQYDGMITCTCVDKFACVKCPENLAEFKNWVNISLANIWSPA